jgi:predicted Zn-dependent peptidase
VAKKSVTQVVESILAELRDLIRNPLPAEELRRGKDHMKGSLVLGLEGSGSRMSNLARQHLFHGRTFTVDEVIAGIDGVTAEDVQRLARELFGRRRIGLALLGPVDGIGLHAEEIRC